MIRFFLATILPALLVASEAVEPEHVRTSVEAMLRDGIPARGLAARPGHPLLRDPEAFEQFSADVVEAGHAHSVSPFLLVAIATREGSLTIGGEGLLGEQTVFQMVPAVIRVVRRYESRCSPDTIRGSAFCASAWLALWRGRCGSWGGALSIYATGKKCKPPQGSRAEWVVRDRLALARWLESRSIQ